MKACYLTPICSPLTSSSSAWLERSLLKHQRGRSQTTEPQTSLTRGTGSAYSKHNCFVKVKFDTRIECFHCKLEAVSAVSMAGYVSTLHPIRSSIMTTCAVQVLLVIHHTDSKYCHAMTDLSSIQKYQISTKW